MPGNWPPLLALRFALCSLLFALRSFAFAVKLFNLPLALSAERWYRSDMRGKRKRNGDYAYCAKKEPSRNKSNPCIDLDLKCAYLGTMMAFEPFCNSLSYLELDTF
jgi:hypothetical protein